MLCVGDARVGPIPRRWWAVALPDGTLHEGRGGLRLEGSRVLVEVWKTLRKRWIWVVTLTVSSWVPGPGP